MADKKATRESYGQALAELGEKYDFLVLDADLAAATKTGMFKKKFPERFFDCGIAEGNMVSVAAGIATTGKVVFARFSCDIFFIIISHLSASVLLFDIGRARYSNSGS